MVSRSDIGFLTKPLNDKIHRFPEAGGGLFSTTHDILRYGLMLANDGELDGKRYLSSAAMDELRKEQTGKTRINYSLGYHLRDGMFGHDGAMAPICPSIPKQEWWPSSWYNALAVTSGQLAICFSKRPRKSIPDE